MDQHNIYKYDGKKFTSSFTMRGLTLRHLAGLDEGGVTPGCHSVAPTRRTKEGPVSG